MFRRLFLAHLALLVASLAGFGILSARATRARVLGEIARRLEVEALLLASLAGPAPDRSSLQPALERLGSAFGGRLTVVAGDGNVIADSHADPAGMDNHDARPEVRLARRMGAGTDVRYSDTVRYDMMYHARRLDPARPDGPVVRSALPITRVNEELGALTRGIAAAFVIIGLAGAAVTYVLTRRITRPLREIRSVAEAVAAGDFSRRAASSSAPEIAGVAAAINRMADELSLRLDRVRAEGARLEAVLWSLQDGVIAVDREGRVLHHNAAARTLFGLAHDPAGLRVWEVVRVPGLEEKIRGALEAGSPADLPAEAGPRALAISIRPTAGGAGAVLVARDVSEERRYDRLRREFVANVSHELRTPLTLIKGYVETLKDGALQDPGRAPEFLETIERNVQRLSALVGDLLELSRLESGGQLVNPRAVEGRELLEAVLADLRPLAEKKRQALTLEIAPDLGEFTADPELLDRAVSNLVDNAIKYTPEGGAVTVRGSAEAEVVVISVEDTGPGIPEADLPRVFERFYRVDKSRSRELGGTGLGLAIVKHVAQLHGGTVAVRSRVGEGSVFTLRLPR